VKARAAILAGLLASRAPSLQAQAPPVFGARVESVYVDAFVTRDGQAVQGLQPSDFELKDNGVVQDVALVTSDSLPLVTVLAFDVSGSVAGPKLSALQSAGGAFLDALKPGDEAALLAFNEEIRWASEPTPERPRVKAALAGLLPRGGTAAFDGLYAAIVLPASKARSLVVLFSDGEDNLSLLSGEQVKQVAERSNALVHVVGIVPAAAGAGLSPTPNASGGPSLPARRDPPELPYNRQLRLIAESTGGRFWPSETHARLGATFAAIAEAMRHRYVLRYEPKAGATAGWHRIELKLRGKSGRVEARRGYWVAGR
jgi:VWFA-related protein